MIVAIPAKVYLGDGAFVVKEPERGAISLQTEDGLGVTNRVYLGPDELRAFIGYLMETGIMTITSIGKPDLGETS